VWRLRRSPLVRAALGWVAKICLAMLAVVFVITLFFVWAFGHPVAWSVIGCLFGALPLAGLVLTVGVGLRAAVVAGPGRIAVRFLGRWRVIDLGQVRAVRLGEQGPFGGGGLRGFGFRFGGPNGVGGPGGFGGTGGLVFEDVHGQHVQIGLDALDAGLAAVVREGLASDAVIDVDAARALGRGTEPVASTDAPGTGAPEQGGSPRP